MDQKILVLDLDETLVLVIKEPLLDVEPDAEIEDKYYVYYRPYLVEFLREVEETGYTVVIWSSGSEAYVNSVVKVLPSFRNLAHVWSRKQCTVCKTGFPAEVRRIRNGLPWCFDKYTKSLWKIKRKFQVPWGNILIVDDSPEKAEQNVGNYIRVSSFRGDQKDSVLQKLLNYLKSIHPEENFQKLDHGQWEKVSALM